MTIQPQQQKSTSSSKLFIFIICLLFRFLNAFLTRTYDNPDEYWQGQEVAHHLVFGNGYLTWEWREKIRSFAHPLAIASVYKLLQLLRLDDTMLLMAAPRYFQATLAAIADVSTYALAKQVLGNDIAFPMVTKIPRKKSYQSTYTMYYSYLLHYVPGSTSIWQHVHFPTVWRWYLPCWHSIFGLLFSSNGLDR
jgi:hypothetical protein